jgi:hypothetical protein
MVQMLQKPENAILALHITGEISDRETRRIVSAIRTHATPGRRVRLFLRMDHYASFNSAESLYEDLRFCRQCGELIERMAIVGDRSWKATWVALFGLFGAIEMTYFDRSESQAAWQWLNKS